MGRARGVGGGAVGSSCRFLKAHRAQPVGKVPPRRSSARSGLRGLGPLTPSCLASLQPLLQLGAWPPVNLRATFRPRLAAEPSLPPGPGRFSVSRHRPHGTAEPVHTLFSPHGPGTWRTEGGRKQRCPLHPTVPGAGWDEEAVAGTAQGPPSAGSGPVRPPRLRTVRPWPPGRCALGALRPLTCQRRRACSAWLCCSSRSTRSPVAATATAALATCLPPRRSCSGTRRAAGR